MTKWGLVVLVSLAVVPETNALGQDRGGGPRTLGDSAADLVYTPVTPCRIVDTRLAGGTLTPGVPRSVVVSGTGGFEAQGGKPGGCAVPDEATAVMVNFVAVAAAGPGNMQAWPFGEPEPLASIINYAAVGLNIANGVAVPICNSAVTTCAFDLTVRANVSAIQLVADVLGFFKTTGPVGDMTAVNAGTGLTGGGTSGDVTLGVDSSTTQLRVNGACPPGSSIQAINENGTVLCQADTNSGGTVTSVAAGTGLLGGTITTSGTISADFAGTGSANTIARSNHTHAPPPPVTQTKTISALTCIAQGGAFSGDTNTCGGGGMVRTDGDSNFPCVVRARTVRDTWLCNLDLPPNSQITNITAYAYDLANDGYMEALVWRVNATTLVGNDNFSNFGGAWQSSGTAFAAGQTSFPIFSSVTPHTVSGNHHYVIGFGMKSPTNQTLYAEGFRVTYTTP
jgi:hypothetical protein